MSCRSNSFFHEGFQNNDKNNDKKQNNTTKKIMNQPNIPLMKPNNSKSKLNMKVLSFIIVFLVLSGLLIFIRNNKN
jgi:hypothetical protein